MHYRMCSLESNVFSYIETLWCRHWDLRFRYRMYRWWPISDLVSKRSCGMSITCPEKGVLLWKRCFPMKKVFSYDKGVLLWEKYSLIWIAFANVCSKSKIPCNPCGISTTCPHKVFSDEKGFLLWKTCSLHGLCSLIYNSKDSCGMSITCPEKRCSLT